MALAAFLEPWQARVYRHISHDSPLGLLDFRYAGRGRRNRWNDPGEATLYLAGDPHLAGLEFFRHIDDDRDSLSGSYTVTRDVYWLDVVLQRVIDVRRSDVQAALALDDAPNCFLNIQIARAAAKLVRYGTEEVQSLVVPSVACLDQPERWSLVLFLDHLPADVRQFITNFGLHSMLQVGPPSPPASV